MVEVFLIHLIPHNLSVFIINIVIDIILWRQFIWDLVVVDDHLLPLASFRLPLPIPMRRSLLRRTAALPQISYGFLFDGVIDLGVHLGLDVVALDLRGLGCWLGMLRIATGSIVNRRRHGWLLYSLG